MAGGPGHGLENFLIDFLASLGHLLDDLAPIELEVRGLEDAIIDQLNGLLPAVDDKAPIDRPIFLTLLLLFLLLILLEFLFYLDCVTFTIGCLPLEDGLIGDVLPVEDPLLQLVKAGVILELQPDSI